MVLSCPTVSHTHTLPPWLQISRIEEERRLTEEEAAKMKRKQGKIQEETSRKAEEAEKVWGHGDAGAGVAWFMPGCAYVWPLLPYWLAAVQTRASTLPGPPVIDLPLLHP